MVNIAIVGAGFIGKIHSDSYKQIDDANVVAVVDKVKDKGRELSSQHGAAYYSDIDECLLKEDVDNVDICVPTFLHAELTTKAADAGKNVFCEKPMALSLDEADRMIEAVEANNVEGMVGHVIRFWPEYIKAKEVIQSGQLGKPLYGYCQRLAVTPDWHQDNWGMEERYSGGAAVDLHIHDLDYLIWLFGRPKLVSAQGVYNPENIEHGGLVHIVTNMEFGSGVAASAEGGWAFKGAFPFTMVFRILCTEGTIEWVFRAGKNIEQRVQAAKVTVYRPDGSTEELEVDKTDAYQLECGYFVDCTHNQKPVEKATFSDGRLALELALAAVDSAKNKNVVKF
ncbi:MAG: Gfo/Idh/MocA family protein [Actinomycetota bacterium]